ncbi:MAG: LptE family protein [Candidatus Omnitrophota bacterium]
MKKKAWLLVIFYFLFSALCAGCGYTTRSLISEKYKTIHIVPFANKVELTRESDSNNKYKVYRPMLETELTKAVINKFLYDGNVKPVAHDSADLVLKADLVEFRRDPLRYVDNDNIEEYRINIVVNINLWDKKNSKLVWEENNFTGDASYFVTDPQDSEDRAVQDAIKDLSRRIVERVIEQW